MRKKNKLVCGVGINDADYVVQPEINGKRITCPFYRVWQDMLKRCYSKKLQAKYPTYIGCIVCDEWLTFSNFKSWMETQDWVGKQLDKDLLVVGNKIYAPETCVFVARMTNTFILDHGADRGEWPIGVTFDKWVGKFRAQCSNPFGNTAYEIRGYISYFNCPNAAHLAWKKRKHELALQLADLQTDERVAKALRERYYVDNAG